MPEDQPSTCPSCGAGLTERFCPKCGEKRFDAGSLGLRHVLDEALEGIFHFDNKFFRSVKTLCLRPGQMSVDFVEGRKVGAVRPLPLFLIINLIVFLTLAYNPFSIPLGNYLRYEPFIDYGTQGLVEFKVATLGTTTAEFTKRFNDAMHRMSKTWLVLFIPAHAVLFGLLFLPKRRKVMEHLVFATHYIAFALIAFPVIAWLIGLPIELITAAKGADGLSMDSDLLVATTFLLAFSAYLFLAIKRFYRVGWPYALLTGTLVGAGFFLMLQWYRMLLFFLVIRALD